MRIWFPHGVPYVYDSPYPGRLWLSSGLSVRVAYQWTETGVELTYRVHDRPSIRDMQETAAIMDSIIANSAHPDMHRAGRQLLREEDDGSQTSGTK
jgi:hypothetical protein